MQPDGRGTRTPVEAKGQRTTGCVLTSSVLSIERVRDKKHFSQDFSVAGIGDMAGDVFGNGMLQSRHIRLIAAFNHQHIFIDPQPDAARSYKERERLFKLPRSSW